MSAASLDDGPSPGGERAGGGSGTYTGSFFAEQRSRSRDSADAVVPWLMEVLRPGRVLDVGCGLGTWLAVFRRHGVVDVQGIDGDWVPQDALEIPSDCFQRHDLGTPLPALGLYDLVVSLEVAEHLPPDCADRFVADLVSAAPVVFFSAAVPEQGGTGHLNEQWPAYWIARFEQHDYQCVDCVRGRFWDDPHVARWYVQNGLCFVRRDSVSRYPRLLEEERRSSFGARSVVHPRSYLVQAAALKRAADPRNLSLRQLLFALPGVARQTLSRKLHASFRSSRL